jgi:hypothetical protein
MKVGAKFDALGLDEGIHWHINPDVKIEYVSTDEKRQTIPWVKYTDLRTGKVEIFESEDEPLEEGQISKLEVRPVDCIDCHNRPSHNYNPPEFFINNAITAGEISRDLPEIKLAATEVCTEIYTTTDSAFMGIRNGLEEFYNENYPEVISENNDELQQAIAAIQKYFSRNIFPEMKVRWTEYPINIGHIKTNGCFRCHDDNHVSESGRVISKDCNLCHSINSQGKPGEMMKTTIDESLVFLHPGDDVVQEDWEDGLCSDCHEGDGP